MDESPRTFSKKERICGEKSISHLLSKGRYGREGVLRYCFVPGGEGSRIMVSVPKKMFKRAVRRNLLKRRIREAYRHQKELLAGRPADILFIYGSKTEASYGEIFEAVGDALRKVGNAVPARTADEADAGADVQDAGASVQ